MYQEKSPQDQWLDEATRGIRFGDDRRAVRAELQAHLEDKAADLQRIFPGLDRRRILSRVLEEMGDPEDLSQALAAVHKPWLGYLWTVSRWLVGLSLCAALLCWGGRGLTALREWNDLRQVSQDFPSYDDQVHEYYLTGDPDLPFPLSPAASGTEPGLLRSPLRRVGETSQVHAGTFTLTVTRGALWSIMEEGESEAYYLLECELTARGDLGQRLNLEAVYQIGGTDSLGNRYLSTRSGHSTGQPYILAMELSGGDNPQRFRLSVSDVPPQAEWLRLEYDWGGLDWELTIPLEEV